MNIHPVETLISRSLQDQYSLNLRVITSLADSNVGIHRLRTELVLDVDKSCVSGGKCLLHDQRNLVSHVCFGGGA